MFRPTTVLLEINDGLARITLNRPPANTIDLELAVELARVSLRCTTNREIRAVLLTGSGSVFSAGGDLKVFAKQGDNLPEYLRKVTSHFHTAIVRLTQLNMPLIIAVNGLAAGGGFSLACSGDIVIAAESASFVMSYTHVGLVPDGGSTYVLPRLVGLRRAQELAMLNRRLNANEALAWGVVTEVVPDVALPIRALTVAQTLAEGPTLALGSTKRLFASSNRGHSLEKHMQLESFAIARAGAKVDAREGIAAFLDKRKPKFEGR